MKLIVEIVGKSANFYFKNPQNFECLYLTGGQAEDNGGAIAGPVNHQVQVAVLQVKHGSYIQIVLEPPTDSGYHFWRVCE